MDGWASRGGGAGVGNLARKPAKPSSSGRKLTIKPFKGASAPPPRDAPRDRSGSPPALGYAPGAAIRRRIAQLHLQVLQVGQQPHVAPTAQVAAIIGRHVRVGGDTPQLRRVL